MRIRLERFHLRLDIPPRIILELLAPRLHGVHAGARADMRGPGVRPIVPGTDTVPVQRCRAVRHSRRPLAHEGPLIGAGVGVRVVAYVLPVLAGLHGDELVSEDLVFVVVDGYPFAVVDGGGEPIVIGPRFLEAVLDDDDTGVRHGALLAVGGALELLDDFKVERWYEGSVE